MKEIQKKIKQGGWINNDEEVTVKKFGNMIRIQNSTNTQNHLKNFKRISKDTYLDNTGEEKRYKHNKKKTIKGVQKEIAKAKDLLIRNFYGHQNVLFITLTYEEATMDFEYVKKCFRNFKRKMVRRYGNLKYFYVIELQKNRNEPSLHIHCALKHIERKRFKVDDNKIRNLWGQGFTKTKRLYSIEDITSYFFKDFLDEQNLKIYSKYSNIYFCSLGLEQVDEVKIKMAEFIKTYGKDFFKNNSVIINIIDPETGKVMCSHKKQTYKLRKHHKRTLCKVKYPMPLRFIKVIGNAIICDDIYYKKRYEKRYGIEIALDTKNTELINKVKKLKKGKHWFKIEKEFFKPLNENAIVLDKLDDVDIEEKHLF